MSDIDKSADEICPILISFCPHLIRDLAPAVTTFVTNNEGNDCPQHTFTSKTITVMKQKLLHQSLIVTLVTMVLLLAGSSVSAQEEYGLKIAGERVTSANCSDLTAIPGVAGKVSYDPTTKTLTLEDAFIDEGKYPGILSDDELTCVVKGEVRADAL